jgi:hypothetical protein
LGALGVRWLWHRFQRARSALWSAAATLPLFIPVAKPPV